jgi:O-antigen ligase
MSNPKRSRYFSLLWLLLVIAALLSIGALNRHQEFLERGLPDGLPGPIPEGGVRLGINVNLEQYSEDELTENLDQLQEIGFGYLKQSFYYNEAFNWQESDHIVSAVSEHGFVLAPLLDGNPAHSFAPPEDPADFAIWAGEFAARYAELLHYYIIWDEPNLSNHWGNEPVNPADYAALLTAAGEAIRMADPDAIIISAPLAPTTERGLGNLADPIFLQQLYESGANDAFDVVAGKPYGFDTGFDDRIVDLESLNFSRIILLREVMEQNGDGQKPIWAGNWGWNSLPDGWSGTPSIWGQTSESNQALQTVAATDRAQREWPWMGVMFLENWQPNVPVSDPRWGFSIAGRETAATVATHLQNLDGRVALPGFHSPQRDDDAQRYVGGWRFSPEFGADISQSGDSVSFSFWGTDVGLRVRKADYRARLYVTVDQNPANALPMDENGSMLILTSADTSEDVISTEWVARDLDPGEHVLTLEAMRGWDQWALNGFSVGYMPSDAGYRRVLIGLVAATVLTTVLAIRSGRRSDWGDLRDRLSQAFTSLNQKQQLVLTAVAAGIVTLAGWLTWGQQAAGLYRRLDDVSQLALTAAVASVFYVAPEFVIYVGALALLFVLIYFRPAWGVALIAFSAPFYVLPKPMVGYRFSPVEVFTLLSVAAFLLTRITELVSRSEPHPVQISAHELFASLHSVDYSVAAFAMVATLSLLFTERLDVATNEWRILIMEPVLFYLLLRSAKLSRRELWVVLDAFVLGGLVVALYGLWQYAIGENLITAEGGLMRLRSIYGSPNNVGLFLGRIFPILASMALMGTDLNGKRRWIYGVILFPVGLAILLSFSRGALFLGIPAATLYVFWRWQRAAGRRTWPWLVAFSGVAAVIVTLALQTSALAGRFDLRGATGVFRINLWRASVNMFADHPLLGVGLDNFLYAYRGRYIFDAAWQEPDLSHPHNVLLDFATRLGVLGLLAGGWMILALYRTLRRLQIQKTSVWAPVAIGLVGALVDMLAHGFVDHSLFLVDLSFAFFLVVGIAVWLETSTQLAEP